MFQEYNFIFCIVTFLKSLITTLFFNAIYYFLVLGQLVRDVLLFMLESVYYQWKILRLSKSCT